MDESTGGIIQAEAVPHPIAIQFHGESAVGDGLRREWFGELLKEMLDPARGLFVSKDGGCTLQPSPHSATTTGPDHLSYFALLGRLAGLALYHKEPLNASWSDAFIKAVLGWSIEPADLESVDPDLYQQRVLYIQDSVYASRDQLTLADLDLVFVDDGNDEAIIYNTEAERRRAVELQPNGADIAVNEDNKAEYLRLFVQHRLIGAIEPQIKAFRGGLGVFVDDALRAKLRKCCTVGHMQILMCGAVEIDVVDWKTSTVTVGFDDGSSTVQWFWALVNVMSEGERSTLLHFCTGSARAPAAGFGSLMGYNGQQHRFTIKCMAGGADRLPTASTCFNTLNLPEYENEGQFKAKLLLALSGGVGFHEGAVAV